MEIINTVSREFWDDVISQSNHATFFHTYIWAKIISDTFPEYSVRTKGFVFDDGTKAILPLILTRSKLKNFVQTYCSMVPGVFGGIISNGRRLTQKEIRSIFFSFKGLKFNNIFYVSNPFCDYEIPNYYNKYAMFTQVLNLEEGYNSILNKYSRNNKCNIKKAKKMGIHVDVGSSLEDYKVYYKIYEDCLRRWGDKASNCYSFALFQNICNTKSPNIKLWLAKINDNVVAGVLVFYCNKHVVAWHGASLESYFDYRPNNLLFSEIIRDACIKSYWCFDFNPSGSHDGVVKFKQTFGTEQLDFSAYKWSSNVLYKFYLEHRQPF